MIERFGPVEMPQPTRKQAPAPESQRATAFQDLLGVAPPTSAAQTPSVQNADGIEITLREAGGQGQSILLPWRLFANDALSQSLLSASELATAPVPAFDGSPARTVAATAQTQTGAVYGGTAGLASSAAAPVASVATTASPHAMRGSETATTPAAPAAMFASAEPWQARLVRWLEKPGRGATARVRDYRLDAAAQAQLLDSLRAFANENGVQLERVVMNAREVWRAPV